MRLIIEIDDAVFKGAVEAQVGKAISEMAERVILEKIDSIMDTKAERLIDRLVADAGQSIAAVVGNTFKKKKKA